jgi:hypothetical protein
VAKRRRKRETRLGASGDAHVDRLYRAMEIAEASIRNSQRAAAGGRCRLAVSALVHAAEAVGNMNSEELALTQPDIYEAKRLQLSSSKLRRIVGLNLALDKTRAKLQTACKL